MKSQALLVLYPLLMAGAVAFAATPSPSVIGITSLPASVAGVPVDVGSPDGSFVRYMTKGPKFDLSPVIILRAGSTAIDPSLFEMRAKAKEAMTEMGLRAVVKEQQFQSPIAGGKKGFAAEYATGGGYMQSWTIVSGAKAYLVYATVFRESDRVTVWNAVSKDIFRGATYSDLPKDNPQ
jgi:hypothetical protein